ncbi:MAG: hypothetical protein WA774_15535, partial [Candidatus Acidiferrales bacterium]
PPWNDTRAWLVASPGRTAIRAFVASMVLCAAGKGKWRLMFLGWVLSLAFVVPVIFMLEMQ